MKTKAKLPNQGGRKTPMPLPTATQVRAKRAGGRKAAFPK